MGKHISDYLGTIPQCSFLIFNHQAGQTSFRSRFKDLLVCTCLTTGPCSINKGFYPVSVSIQSTTLFELKH